MTIAVVIPAYNEATTIREVATRALAQLDWVIVVDDGSVDATAQCLATLPVTVLRHGENRGKAASLWRGMAHALERGATGVITLDADGQHRPEDMPRLLALAKDRPRALIVAARLQNQERVPPLRRFANRQANFWISWAAGRPLPDTQSGFRLYPAALLEAVRLPCDRAHSFVFESELLIEAARKGFAIRAVAVEALYYSNARASYYRPFWDTALITKMVAWKLISRGLCLPGLLRCLGVWWRLVPTFDVPLASEKEEL
ncbi:MAG: glycosyltransferase family 2 protein [Candidatus Competibacterales bacterium]